MIVLGINGYCFDASVALVADGVPLFYAEEERFNREKKTRAFPAMALERLFAITGVDPASVDAVVCPWDPLKGFVNSVKIVLARFPSSLALVLPHASTECNMVYGTSILGIGRALRRHFPVRPDVGVQYLDHHHCHAALAFHTSPFEAADVLVMDGFGDDCSMSVFAGEGARLERTYHNRMFESIGLLYSIVTRHLGFFAYREEGTVMGLAAHGDPSLEEDFARLVRLSDDGTYGLDWSLLTFDRYGEMRPFSRELSRRLGPARGREDPIEDRHRAIARALQATTERVLLHVTAAMARRSRTGRLCLAGGVALNCLANGRIARESGYRQVHVPAAPGDGGTSLGAALYFTHQRAGVPRVVRPLSPHLGCAYGQREVVEAIEEAGLVARRADDVARQTARMLADGLVVGWFQGRTEMGPRALGGRSILADPRSPDVARRLNGQIKRREPFRPYAPSVLAAGVGRFFEGEATSPYMSFALAARPDMRWRIPAVLQVDGTARLQTVGCGDDPLYRRLLECFEERTGVPMVLNTSFNRREPIVETPRHAVGSFLEMGLDALAIGDHVVTRPAGG